MITINTFREMALSLPEVVELPHFQLASFRINNKIFATLHASDNKAMLVLPLIEQSVFSDIDRAIVYPVPNAWGKKGATFFELRKIKKVILREALQSAWRKAASKKVKETYMSDKQFK